MAIITRWRMPPESWCGYSSSRVSGEGIFTSRSISSARPGPPRRTSGRCSWTASTICSPTVCTGLRLVIGSWKIIAMSSPRTARISLSGRSRRLRPSSLISPAAILPGGLGTSRMIESDVTDLPQPDSPTIPSVSPGASEKLMPSTAANELPPVRNSVRRPFTSRSALVVIPRPQAEGPFLLHQRSLASLGMTSRVMAK